MPFGRKNVAKANSLASAEVGGIMMSSSIRHSPFAIRHAAIVEGGKNG
jgi:hypothetical protein